MTAASWRDIALHFIFKRYAVRDPGDPMTIIDKRQKPPRKRREEETPPPAPYQIHRATFTDGQGPAPAVVAVDAQPRAGDPRAFNPRKIQPR